MGGANVRDLLNRLRWAGSGDAGAVVIGYVGRAEGREMMELAHFDDVLEIMPGGVTLSGETFIPYHRLRFVRRDDEVLWRARARRVDDES